MKADTFFLFNAARFITLKLIYKLADLCVDKVYCNKCGSTKTQRNSRMDGLGIVFLGVAVYIASGDCGQPGVGK